MQNCLEKCTHCGECCKIPGILLPGQIDVLGGQLGLVRKELFDRYLIAQLCAASDSYASPDDCLAPVFVVTPVRVGKNGNRLPQRIHDIAYGQARHLHCIFRDRVNNRCSIYQIRPLECAVTLCSHMTGDKPLFLERRFYYNKWKDNQEIVFSALPELRPLYEKLERSVAAMRDSFQLRNIVMNGEIATLFNGYPHDVPICI